MSVAIVQNTGQGPTTSTAVAFTLSATPAAGNILVAFTAYSQFANSRTIGSAAGTWTKIDDFTQPTTSLAVWWHLVVGGDGKTWSFPVTGASTDNTAGSLYEVSGADPTTPINQFAHLGYTGTVNSAVTASVTPSVLSTLALAGLTLDNNSMVAGAANTGWTKDFEGLGSFHPISSAHRNALTSDTTTAITNTFTFTGSGTGNPSVSMIVLVGPAAAGAAVSHNLTMLGVGT